MIPAAPTQAGEMIVLTRSFDWARTPVGEISAWPQSLRTTVSLLLGSRYPMFLFWGNEAVCFYNDAYRPSLGAHKHPQALGQLGQECWVDIWPIIGPQIESIMAGGPPTWHEDQLVPFDRNGFLEEIYFTYSYSPVRDESGNVGGVLVVCTETTGRVIGERRLRTFRDLSAAAGQPESVSEAWRNAAALIAQNTRDIPFALLYEVDDSGRTAALASAAGLPMDDRRAVARLLLQGDGADVWPAGEVVRSGQALELELPASERPVLPDWPEPVRRVSVVPIARPGHDRAAGVLVAGLSPRLPFDAAYRDFLTLVAAHVGAGVANARAHAEERRRAEALTELDRAKTTFFSNVSHEFRTPLTLILGPLQQAADAAPPDVREQIEVARRNGLRLLKLVNTLLDFSRIEAGRVQARYQPTDLSAFTTELASTFRSTLQKAGLALTVACDPLPEPVYVDRDMWEKIVLNLLSNAFKFTFEGGVTVTLTASGGSHVRLAVQDTGAGIPGPHLARVFDRFHRIEGARGRTHEGSGIGLALVSELVKMHGGTLSVSSQVGQGSTFTVTIPFGSGHLPPESVASVAAEASGPVGADAYVEEALRWLPPAGAPGMDDAAPAGAPPAFPAPGVGGRILLADDNADMREYVRKLLSERWTVEVVGNGLEALHAARARRPDVIIADVMMPVMDGFGLVREIRADETLRATPVIMLSARAGEEARIEGFAASADDYLVKPFSARELIARVDAQLLKAKIRSLEHVHAQRLKNVFMHTPIGIAVVRGPQHVYELANAPYLELVGHRPVVGKSIREALPELAGQGLYELFDCVRASGEPYVDRSLRLMLNRGRGGAPEECYFDFVFQPILDDDGSVDAIAIVAYEVTALAVAKREAEGANRLKDEFLATLSHELRTPLNAVLGYTQMLRAGVIDERRRASVLETIERNARLQEQLIGDVLDVSRIITGKLRLEVRPVDLVQVLEDALATVRPAANAKGVRLQPIIEPLGVPVAGDAQRLQQVAWNLLSNAVKFTPRGGRVQLRLQRVNSHLEITVSDTGEGITPEFLPHLFERFRQADSAPSRTHGGLGLGLAICRHLVEAHGGRIEATSPGKGQGATFRVELPLMIVHDTVHDAERVHPTVEMPTAADLALADLAAVRVLLVDDDADALQMAKDVLSVAGAEVTTARSGAAALRALDRDTFDVAVLDIGMPGMDGYQLIREIRARSVERNGGIPAAALTAYARVADRSRSLQAGFQMHLAKPIQPTELAAAISALASGPRRSPAI